MSPLPASSSAGSRCYPFRLREDLVIFYDILITSRRIIPFATWFSCVKIALSLLGGTNRNEHCGFIGGPWRRNQSDLLVAVVVTAGGDVHRVVVSGVNEAVGLVDAA